jgi:DNA uptake protein ComE-like DNA-binding protein/endonuclease YncB( thermonuclease family)
LIVRSSISLRLAKTAAISAAVVWATIGDVPGRDGSKNWSVLKDCRLIANPANDGDSFHVSAGGRGYLFRLYFVDAPETDEMIPRRLVEQAKYFGITVPQAIEVGRAAKDFTQETLSQPFTVFTHMSDAMGQSRIERFYAFVQTKDGDLGELLVRNGLARNYGFKATPPGLSSSRIELEKLEQFENQARQARIGAWGVGVGRLKRHPQMQSSSSFISVETTHSPPTRDDSSVVFPGTPNPQSSIPRRTSVQKNKSHVKEKTPLGRIEVNTATEKELMTVPGVGHVMAARIIAARPLRSADDLKKVSGIGDKRYAQIRPYFQ